MKNPRKAHKELNRLLGSRKRKKIEVVRTGEGVITDKKGIADELCMYFLFIVGNLLRTVRCLDTSKAVGMDMVSAKIAEDSC